MFLIVWMPFSPRRSLLLWSLFPYSILLLGIILFVGPAGFTVWLWIKKNNYFLFLFRLKVRSGLLMGDRLLICLFQQLKKLICYSRTVRDVTDTDLTPTTAWQTRKDNEFKNKKAFGSSVTGKFPMLLKPNFQGNKTYSGNKTLVFRGFTWNYIATLVRNQRYKTLLNRALALSRKTLLDKPRMNYYNYILK